MARKDKKSATPEPAAAEQPSGSEKGFDGILSELEDVVESLEKGDLPLEEALGAFERGVFLARDGERILSDADQRVEKLLKSRQEPGVRREPFAPGSPTPDDTP